MNRWIQFGLLITIAVIAAFALALMSLNRFLNTPVKIHEDGLIYEIPQGTAFAHVSNDLADRGIISNPKWYTWYARYTGEANAIRAGEYRLNVGDTPVDILNKFVSGQVELYSFTIVEGWNFRPLSYRALQFFPVL